MPASLQFLRFVNPAPIDEQAQGKKQKKKGKSEVKQPMEEKMDDLKIQETSEHKNVGNIVADLLLLKQKL